MNLFRAPMRLPMIAPSILSADFMRMGEECRHVLDAGGGGADLLHLDVMDGSFVPNLTMGPDMCRWLRRELPGAFLDVHLMVREPWKFVDAFADAGADHLTFHVEVMRDRAALAEMAGLVRGRGMSAGLAINPPTPMDRLWALVDAREGGAAAAGVDLVLVMSVNPGFSGQAFIEGALEKTRAARAALGGGVRVQMDGGLKPENAAKVRAAGCDVLVAASAVFGVERGKRGEAVRALRGG